MSYYFIIDYLYPRKRLAAQVSPIVSLISEARINYNSIEDALWNDDNDNKLRPLAERDSRETRKANRGVAFKGDRKKGPTSVLRNALCIWLVLRLPPRKVEGLIRRQTRGKQLNSLRSGTGKTNHDINVGIVV